VLRDFELTKIPSQASTESKRKVGNHHTLLLMADYVNFFFLRTKMPAANAGSNNPKMNGASGTGETSATLNEVPP